MRQVNPPAHHQRHRADAYRTGLVPRPPGRRDQSRMRARVPIVRASAMALGQGQRRARPRSAGIAAGRARKARGLLHRQGRTRRLRRGLPARAVRRHEAARRFRASARSRAQSADARRAVLRARRPDRDHAARRIARHLAVAGHAGEKSHHRHTHHRGGDRAGRSNHRDGGESRPHRPGSQGRIAPPARSPRRSLQRPHRQGLLDDRGARLMAAPAITPLPDCGLTLVFGLLEFLEDRGGREDGYKIARDLNFKFSDLLKVMKAGESLGLVSTPAGDVVLEPLGKQFLAAQVNDRKLMLREQLKKHSLFSYFIRLLHGQEDKSLTKEVVLEHLAMLLPSEKPERQFMALVNWGRYAELFGYNKDEDRFYLDHE